MTNIGKYSKHKFEVSPLVILYRTINNIGCVIEKDKKSNSCSLETLQIPILLDIYQAKGCYYVYIYTLHSSRDCSSIVYGLA